MIIQNSVTRGQKSLPVWEEWIEIFLPMQAEQKVYVSSRMGRVD